ncbi:MAG: hypothetical protein V4709_05110 [Pseudomonadota bacterium]
MTDTPYPHINRNRSRAQFVLLGLLFFAPFVLAYSAYWLFPNWTPEGRTNYGQLIAPAKPAPVLALTDAEGKPLAADPLRGKWTLVQLLPGDCSEACRRELVLTRQLHAALGVKRERVQRVLLAAPGVDLAALKAQLGAEQPDLLLLGDVSSNAAAFFAGPPAASVMLIDPLGSWLMTYPHAADEEAVKRDFRGMQKDINKLLKLSSIG